MSEERRMKKLSWPVSGVMIVFCMMLFDIAGAEPHKLGVSAGYGQSKDNIDVFRFGIQNHFLLNGLYPGPGLCPDILNCPITGGINPMIPRTGWDFLRCLPTILSRSALKGLFLISKAGSVWPILMSIELAVGICPAIFNLKTVSVLACCSTGWISNSGICIIPTQTWNRPMTG